jgi:hypothetical protein
VVAAVLVLLTQVTEVVTAVLGYQIVLLDQASFIAAAAVAVLIAELPALVAVVLEETEVLLLGWLETQELQIQAAAVVVVGLPAMAGLAGLVL